MCSFCARITSNATDPSLASRTVKPFIRNIVEMSLPQHTVIFHK